MTSMRWKLWEWASWLAWWLCPDKKALAVIQKYGTVVSRYALNTRNERAAAKEGK